MQLKNHVLGRSDINGLCSVAVMKTSNVWFLNDLAGV